MASDRLAAGGIVERIPTRPAAAATAATASSWRSARASRPATSTARDIVDLAPTALHAMGLAVPDDMDGRVLTELFSDGREVRTEAARDRDAEQESVYTDEEEAAIEAVPQEPRLHLKNRGLTPFSQAGGSFCTLCSVA